MGVRHIYKSDEERLLTTAPTLSDFSLKMQYLSGQPIQYWLNGAFRFSFIFGCIFTFIVLCYCAHTTIKATIKEFPVWNDDERICRIGTWIMFLFAIFWCMVLSCYYVNMAVIFL